MMEHYHFYDLPMKYRLAYRWSIIGQLWICASKVTTHFRRFQIANEIPPLSLLDNLQKEIKRRKKKEKTGNPLNLFQNDVFPGCGLGGIVRPILQLARLTSTLLFLNNLTLSLFHSLYLFYLFLGAFSCWCCVESLMKCGGRINCDAECQSTHKATWDASHKNDPSTIISTLVHQCRPSHLIVYSASSSSFFERNQFPCHQRWNIRC